jgi:hypothetical protein
MFDQNTCTQQSKPLKTPTDMNTDQQSKKITTEGIKNISVADGSLAVGASAIGIASATDGLSTSIDALASAQTDLAANVGDLADAEVTGSIIGAVGDIIGGIIEGFMP